VFIFNIVIIIIIIIIISSSSDCYIVISDCVLFSSTYVRGLFGLRWTFSRLLLIFFIFYFIFLLLIILSYTIYLCRLSICRRNIVWFRILVIIFKSTFIEQSP
jgi:hypothetical protein